MFMKTAVLRMIASSAFGLGIGKPNIPFVINYVWNILDYLQMAGRAGYNKQVVAYCIIFTNEVEINGV